MKRAGGRHYTLTKNNWKLKEMDYLEYKFYKISCQAESRKYLSPRPKFADFNHAKNVAEEAIEKP